MKFDAIAVNCLLCSSVDGLGTSMVAAAAAPTASADTFLDARPSVASLERKFVGDGTTLSYEDQLVRFILHLFDNNKSFFDDEHLTSMEGAHLVKSDLKDMIVGFEPGDLGTHSARKGVGTMVAAGCTVSPPIVSLCLRAGWALGGVKDKYLFRENAGDMHVGRCASCHDADTKEFWGISIQMQSRRCISLTLIAF